METLKKKYGLFTAVCMVVGIVIGSGIFFKAPDVLANAGSAFNSTMAWMIAGFIMVIIATSFGVLATKYEKVNGIVDYAEATCGKRYAYFVGWFMSLVYYPAMTSVLAWVSARYTLVAALGNDDKIFSTECITLSLFYLVLAYFVNTIAPRIAGKFQISSTIVKLVPIVIIAVVGSVVGLFNGTLVSNFSVEYSASIENPGLFPAICSTIFAYEGWIVATAINSEIRDSKRNLPIALCLGTLIIVAAYTLYNLGVLGLSDINSLSDGTHVAFKFFGDAASVIINVLVVISCLGTLNGLMLGCTRGIYSLSARGEGISPETFVQVDKKTNVPHNSSTFALLMCAIWFVYFIFSATGVFGEYGFDSSELPIITIYPLYVPILIVMMIKERDVHPFKRFVLPILSLAGIGVIIYASIRSHGMDNVWYLIVFAVIMLLGFAVMVNNEKQTKK
ncbi:MAG: APC family permease [Ruminococcaceae bacterium]|nr:APC family permease [Oscillospiraceae bacterium]